MSTPIVGSSPSAIGDGFMAAPIGGGDGVGAGLLPLTGFGPGTLIIAVIGGLLTLAGALMRKLSRRPAPAQN